MRDRRTGIASDGGSGRSVNVENARAVRRSERAAVFNGAVGDHNQLTLATKRSDAGQAPRERFQIALKWNYECE